MKGVTRQTGIISDIDETSVRVRVTLPECDNLKSNWLAVLQRNSQDNKDYWLPDMGEQVEVLLDNNGEDGVVLGAVYSTVDTAPVASRDKRYVQFSDGAAFEYDRSTHQLTINGGLDKIVIEVKAAAVTVDAPMSTFTGNVTVMKKLTWLGGMAGSGGIGNAATITGNVNVIGNVQASGALQDSGGNSNHHSH